MSGRTRRARAKVPTVLQMEAVECGAACLAMILAHHDRVVPLEELRLACGVSRDGSKASNILRAARHYGLVAKGYKKEPGELKELGFPQIVHWNFNHFVVLEGLREGRAYLNDPACGPTTFSQEEFDQSFTGVALVFERGSDFHPGGERPGLLRPLGRRLKGSRLAVAFVVLTGLALLVPGLATPAFTKVFVDDVLVKGLTSWSRPLAILMAATSLIVFALALLQQRHLLKLENRLSLATSSRFFWHVLRLPVEFFTQRYAGEIGSRVAANDRIARLLSRDLATTALSLLLIAAYALLLFQYDAVLALVGVATAALNMAALRYASRRRVNLNQRMLHDRGKLMGTAMGGLQTIETLKATGSESDFFARWSGYAAKVVNADQQLHLTTLWLSSIPPVLLAMNTALILGLGGLRVMDGHLTMGMLVAFQALMLAFLNPVGKLVELGSAVQEVKGDMCRLDDVLQAQLDAFAQDDGGPDEAAEPDDGRELAKLTGHLELRGVAFGYSRLEPPLIEGFDLVLRPGSRVALVGGSGSGKSTVAKLVAGLYQPWSGTILFDGRARHQIPRRVMTASLAVVDQDVSIFEGTVRDNLALWDAALPEADLVQAARDASVHEEITARVGSYGGAVEEGGRNFSGGQRQRLEIARALAANPRILVLDEATSALDPATEKVIDDHLRRRGCTCLIVAHRLSTIRDCDEIVVLDRGKIVQRGTHAELAAVVGPYRSLVAAE